ncbi:MAG: RHS repeat protein, partial [Gammaproteobacteria bacterium]|nr:RHS repeat protein [Gammaproteobacteria bacterium]
MMLQLIRNPICKQVCNVATLIFAFLFLAVSMFITISDSHAHGINPPELTLVYGADETATFVVEDDYTCSATISVQSEHESVVTVSPGSGTGISVEFTITVVGIGETEISIGWVGEDFPDEEGCNENTMGLTRSLPIEVIASGSAEEDGSGNFLQSGTAQDPINTFTGELYSEKVRDLDLGGPMPLYFERYYSSYLRRSFILGDLGSNWRHNFDARLFRSGNTIKYITAEGRVTNFHQDLQSGDWDQLTNTDTPYQLSVVPGEDILVYDPTDERVYTFDFTTNNIIAGKLSKVEDGHGNFHIVNYKTDTGQIETISDGLGRTLVFFYNDEAIPKISVVSDGTRSVTLQYTDPLDTEYLTIAQDVLAGFTQFTYEDTSANADHALMTRMTRPMLNTPFTQTFFGTGNQFASGRVATQTDASGNTFNFDYAGADTTITDPQSNFRTHTHTTTGELSSSKDTAAQDVGIGYDIAGRRNSITDRFGDITTMSYDSASGNLASRTNADGTTSSFTYASRTVNGLTLHDLSGVTHADGTTETLVHDAAGNLISRRDQLGNTNTFTYNGRGQVLTAINTLGGVVTNTYNSDETLATSMNAAGNTTTFGYDVFKRQNLITLADGSTRSTTFNNANNPLTTTDENGNTTTMTYDANGNLVTVKDSLLKIATFAYDGNDRLLTVTDPLGGASSKTYDQLGRIATSTDALNQLRTNGYDVHNRLTSVTDPLLNVWATTYDLEGIIASSSDPLGNTTQYISDKMGRITKATSPLGHISQTGYDAMGRVASTTDALNQVITFNRDARGLLSGIALPGGTISTSMSRNALGNLTSVTDPNGNNWTATYDTSGRLTSSTDPLGQARTIAYDNRNRQSVITLPGILGTKTLTYDGVGNLTGISYSGGTAFGFTYDSNNQMNAANNGGVTPNNMTRSYDANGRISNSNGFAIRRDAGGRITAMTLATGKTLTHAYDASDRLTSVSDWAGGVTTFTYDIAGRLTSTTRPNGVNQTSTWDNDSRLTGLSEGAVSTITLIRDAAGQVAAATRNVPQTASATTLSSR